MPNINKVFLSLWKQNQSFW